jgi:hypothetical protein
MLGEQVQVILLVQVRAMMIKMQRPKWLLIPLA